MYQISTIQPHDHTFKTVAAAWAWAMNFIKANGNDVRTEDGALTREYVGLQLTVTQPGEGWPVEGSGWDMPGLKVYGEQFLSGTSTGHDYNYGERMRFGLMQHWYQYLAGTRRVVGVDQIRVACKMLAENPNTRRAAIQIWEPSTDLGKPGHHPCMLDIVPLIRNDRLNLGVMFRSHDIGRAYVENMYGLYRLQIELLMGMARIGLSRVILPGSIRTFSYSAHYYIQ